MTLLVLTVCRWERAEFGKLRQECGVLYLYKSAQHSPCREQPCPAGQQSLIEGQQQVWVGLEAIHSHPRAAHTLL